MSLGTPHRLAAGEGIGRRMSEVAASVADRVVPAAFFAPEAHQVYLKRMSTAYTRSLRRGHDAGEIEGYDADELEILAVMMIGAREYLLERYMAHGGQIDPMPEKVRRTYLKAVARSLCIDPNAVLSGQVKRDDVADRAERA